MSLDPALNLQIALHNSTLDNDWKKHVTQFEQQERHHKEQLLLASVDRLAYFVISVEVIICGYILLQLKDLHNIPLLVWTFCFAGISAFLGMIWKFCFNFAENRKLLSSKEGSYSWEKSQHIFHMGFVLFSLLTIVFVVFSGAVYITCYR